MARYIDADKFAERIKLSPAFKNMAFEGDLLQRVVLDLIGNALTTDVVEVKHGEWIDYSDKYDRGMDLRCSVCDKRASAFVGGTEDWWDNYKPDYCPNCGAKMDGGNKNDL